MHWTNAVAMLVMIGSGWGIYDDDVIIHGLHFRDNVPARRLGGREPAVALRGDVAAGAERPRLPRLRPRDRAAMRERLLPIRLGRHRPDGARNAALPPRARGPHRLQRGAEASLHRRHSRGDLAGGDRTGDLEAGAAVMARDAARRLPGRAHHPLRWHGGAWSASSWCTSHCRSWCPRTLWAMLVGGPFVNRRPILRREVLP